MAGALVLAACGEEAPEESCGHVKTCPSGRGPKMVLVQAECGSYCIDITEVTQAQYGEFVAEASETNGQPQECGGNVDFSPICTDGSDAPGGPSLPAVCVDWCDAAAFCTWAGKQLCPGGTDALSSWEAACTASGSPPEAAHCNLQSGVLASVGEYTECRSKRPPFDEILDLLGNAEEWTADCSDGTCFALGGAAWSNNAFCTGGTGYSRLRADAFLGFRCCAQ